jgi:exonuclease III
VVVGDFNTPLTPIDSSSTHTHKKIKKEIQELNEAIDQTDLPDVYRTFYLATVQYTFFAGTQGTFSKLDHILGHNVSLNKYKKIEITNCILSDHNAIKLNLNSKSSSKKYTNNWRLNNMSYTW